MKRALILAGCVTLLTACASNHADHFYILSPLPPAAAPARTAPLTQATLRIKLPAWLDRSELVVDTSGDGVTVLEHERWAAPLSDLMLQTLAMDLERRRSNLVISDLGASHAASSINVVVNVTRVSIRRGERVDVEVQWRVVDGGTGAEVIRSGEFHSSLPAEGYTRIAAALSDCLGQLADQIGTEIPQSQ